MFPHQKIDALRGLIFMAEKNEKYSEEHRREIIASLRAILDPLLAEQQQIEALIEGFNKVNRI